MRIDGHSNLGSWFQQAFPRVPLRESPGMNQTCYRVTPPEKATSTPRHAYWSYLERANIRDANIEPGVLPPVKRSFAPMMQAPPPTDAAPTPTPPGTPGNTGLAGPPLGDVPTAEPQKPGPARAPNRFTRISEPGVLGTKLDIIA